MDYQNEVIGKSKGTTQALSWLTGRLVEGINWFMSLSYIEKGLLIGSLIMLVVLIKIIMSENTPKVKN